MKHILLPFVLLLMVHVVTGQLAENDPAFVITGTGFNGLVRAMAVQGDGKVVVGGDFTSYNGTTRNYIARLNADGTLDGAFDASTTLNAGVHSIAIDGSGNIIVGGAFTATVKRLTSAGANDGTFAVAGTGLNGPVYTVAVLANGTVYIGGTFTSYNGTSRNSIARLLSTGALDTGFDPGTGLNGFARKIAVQADGKIVVVGGASGFNSYNGTSRDNIVRIEATGAIDAGFVPPTNLKARMYDVKFQADDKIIITGEYNGDNTSIFNGVARLNTNGSVDNTFTPPFFQGGRSILIQADGKIVIGGLIFGKSIKRVNSNGATDNTFMDGADGFFEPSFAEVTSLVFQEGKILAGGEFDVFNGHQRNRMARITSCSAVGITTHPLNKTVCTGATVTLTLVATGSGLTYQWQRKEVGNAYFQNVSDGAGLTGTLTATLSINSGVAPVAQAYRCLVSDATCTSTGLAAEVIYQVAPTVNTQPQPQVVCAGTNAVFTVDATNSSQYVWQEDTGQGFVDLAPSAVYLNPGTATLTVVGNSSLNGYKYRCRLGTCLPSVTTNEALLTVNSTPSITTNPVGQITFCTGGSGQFSVVATNATGYQWQEKVGSGAFANITNGGIYGGATTSTLTLAGATVSQNSNQYRCILSAANACTTTSQIGILGVFASPIVSTHPANANQCSGTSAQFLVAITSPPVGITYQWQERVTGGSFANITNGGKYSGATTTTLSVSSLIFSMDGYAYRCVVGTCATPVTSFDASLTVWEAPQITTQPAAVTTCSNTDATFTVAAAGSVTYQWQEAQSLGAFANIVAGAGYSGITTATLTLTSVTSAKTGYRYRCVLSNGTCTAVNSSQATLTVRSTPTINNHPTNKTFCGTSSTTFSVSASNHYDTFQWQVTDAAGAFVDVANGGVYSGATTNVLTLTDATPAFSGKQFRCVVGPCTDKVTSNTATLTINEPPAVTTSPVDQTICTGGTTTFTVAATGTSLTYKWIVNGSTVVTNNSIYSGATSATLTVTGATAGMNNHTYVCQLTGASFCSQAESNSAKLTVNQITIDAQPQNVAAFCEGGNTSYSVSASGAGLTYEWQSKIGTGDFAKVSGTVYGGAISETLTITGAPVSLHGTSYRCVVSGLCPTVNSNSVLLQMIQKPAKPVIVVDLSNPEVPVLGVPNSAVNGWKWFKNGTQQISTSAQVSNPGEGSYTVLVSNNGCESVLSDPKVIIVTESEYRRENRVAVYPNPAATTLVVSLAEFKSGEEVDIMLVDMLGRSMERTSGTGGDEKEINVSRFQAGRYLVRMQQGQQQVVAHFIKTNQ